MALYLGETKVAPVVVYIPIDSTLSAVSENTVQNKVITQALNEKQDISNLVTSVSSSSTDSQYPSAKCLYDLTGDLSDFEGILDSIIEGGTWVSFDTFTLSSDGLGLTGKFDEVKISIIDGQVIAFLLNNGSAVTSVSGNAFFFDWANSSYTSATTTFSLNFTDKTNTTVVSVVV